jgi:hypothetical protein
MQASSGPAGDPLAASSSPAPSGPKAYITWPTDQMRVMTRA